MIRFGKDKKMLFKLKRGKHCQRDNKVYKKGDTVESSLDLVTVFGKAKFERDYEAEKKIGIAAVISKPNISPPVDKVEDKGEGKSKSVLSPFGKDVTSEFPAAEKIEVSVFEKSRWYTVVDEADDSVLNKKSLRRKEVEPFLNQYLEGVDTDEE